MWTGDSAKLHDRGGSREECLLWMMREILFGVIRIIGLCDVQRGGERICGTRDSMFGGADEYLWPLSFLQNPLFHRLLEG